MKLYSLEIPAEHEERVAWLEGHLCGRDLLPLVAELETVHQKNSGEPLALSRQCLSDVMRRGLTALKREQLDAFIQHPRQLLQLQELILQQGGEFWISRLQQIELPPLPQLNSSDEIRPASIESSRETGTRRRHGVRGLLIAVALVICAGLALFFRAQPWETSVAWGWNRTAVLDVDLNGGPYLTHLARAADEWFATEPQDAEHLSQRISELLEGCSVLQKAAHRQLANADRDWLYDKCKKWEQAIAVHQVELAAGEEFGVVKRNVDQIVENLSKALRNRASQLDA